MTYDVSPKSVLVSVGFVGALACALAIMLSGSESLAGGSGAVEESKLRYHFRQYDNRLEELLSSVEELQEELAKGESKYKDEFDALEKAYRSLADTKLDKSLRHSAAKTIEDKYQAQKQKIVNEALKKISAELRYLDSGKRNNPFADDEDPYCERPGVRAVVEPVSPPRGGILQRLRRR